MDDIRIRELRFEDIDSVIKLMLKFPDVYPEHYAKSRRMGGITWLLEYILEKNDRLEGNSFVLELNNEVIGHAAYRKDFRCFEGGVYEIMALAVKRENHGKGYGKRLSKFVKDELRDIGGRIAWLQTGNENTVNRYLLEGYSITGYWPGYWGDERVRYQLVCELKNRREIMDDKKAFEELLKLRGGAERIKKITGTKVLGKESLNQLKKELRKEDLFRARSFTSAAKKVVI